MALQSIRKLNFEDPDQARVQDEAIASAERRTEAHIAAYRALPSSLRGRYVAADLFKETFPAYAQDRDSRNRYNNPVHNASAVLSAEQFHRVLIEPGKPAQTHVLFVTGIPGAGKTTSIMTQGRLSDDVKVVFEGQLWRPQTTIPKLQFA